MRRRAPAYRRLLPALLVALPLASARAAPPAATASPGALDGPVIVEGRALGGLLGEPIGALRLLRWTDGRFAAIPFQIDPRERRARPGRLARRLYVLAAPGRSGSIDARPLGPDDELVFMHADLGPRPPPGAAPPQSRGGALIEVAGGGAAALFAFAAPPPRAPRRYLRYHFAGDRVEARTYTLSFSPARPAVLDTLQLHPAGDPGPDILDRVKIRISGTLLHALPFRRNEEDIETRIEGVRAGPVRVVRVVRNRVPLMAGFRSPWVEEAQIFYPDGFEFPIWLAKSPGMSRLLSRLSFRVGPDWSPAALGMKVRTAGSGETFTVDGQMDAAERAMTGEGAAWSVLFGPTGAFFSELAPEPGEREGTAPPEAPGASLRFRLRYRDDVRRADPPEDDPGEIGALAYAFPEAARLPAGEYRWTVRARVLPRYAPGDERAIRAALRPARAVRVTPRRGAPAAPGGASAAP